MSGSDEDLPRAPRRSTTLPVRFAEVDDVVEHPPYGSGVSSRASRSSSRPHQSRNLDALERQKLAEIESIYDDIRAVRKHRHRGPRDTGSWGHRRSGKKPKSRGSDSGSAERLYRDSDDGYDTNSGGSPHPSTRSEIRYPSPPRSRPLERFISATINKDESESEDDAYGFTLTRRTPSALSQESSLGDSDSGKYIEDRINVLASGYGASQGICVVKSQYTGEGIVGGLQKAELTVIQDSKPDRTSLFRWIHIKDRDMIFEDFVDTVIGVPGLDSSEKHNLAKLLNRVKRKFDKPLQTAKNNKSRIMTPGFLQEELSRPSGPKDKHSKPRMATWICVPYFFHDEYSGSKTSSKAGTHPVRTLLQHRFPSVRKERDMQQAVCSLPDNPSGFCFHIAQVWYLILDQSLLVTCAGIDLSTMQGDMVSISYIPKPEGLKAEPQRLLVAYGGSVLWSFPLDDCQSWFALMANFSEFWPQNFRLIHNGKTITQPLWSRIYGLAKRSTFNVHIRLELSGSEKITARGVLNSVKETNEGKGQSPTDVEPGVSDHLWGAGSHESEPTHDDAGGDAQLRRDTKNPDPVPMANGHEDDEGFSVFTWARSSSTQGGQVPFRVDRTQLFQDLKQIDMFLSRYTSLEESLAYKQCPESTYHDVLSSLREQVEAFAEPSSAGQGKEEQKARADLGARVDFFNACESVYQFFLPLWVDGPTARKYWGAVGNLVEPWSSRSQNQSTKRASKGHKYVRIGKQELREVCEAFEDIMLKTKPFRELLSKASISARAKITIPDELVKAWLHLVMSLLNSTLFDSQVGTVYKLLDSGMRQVMQDLCRESLLEKVVLQPLDIASLSSFRILQDINGRSRNICEAYSEYVKNLESGVSSNPLDRGHQVKLARLKQELLIVKDIIAEQMSLVYEMAGANKTSNAREERQIDRVTSLARDHTKSRSTKAPHEDYETDYDRDRSRSRAAARMYFDDHAPTQTQRYGAHYARYAKRDDLTTVGAQISGLSKLSSTDPRGYQELFVQDCLELLSVRELDLYEMKMKAFELETFNIQRIDSNKDRQEAAIYVFTVVTIIFLPLSTVASILGMNTNDIRSMKFTQWVFWATAVPLAIIIILLCLAWVGELKNIWRGLKNLWRGQSREAQNALPAGDGYEREVIIRRPRSPAFYR